MIHEVLPVGQLGCNCSILGDPETGEGIVIDPGDDISEIEAILSKHGLMVKMILITHAHIDHIMGVKAVHEATGAPIYLHRADRPLYDSLPQYGSWVGMQLERPPAPHERIAGVGIAPGFAHGLKRCRVIPVM